jgi:hypothetical protein
MIGRVLVMVLLGCTALPGQTVDGVVSGRVEVPNGGSATSIPVTLTTVSTSARISTATQTNDGGFFRFDNVKPGEYIVFAGAFVATLVPGTSNGARGIVLSPRAAVFARSVGTFFPGTADVSNATAITVIAGGKVENVNFPLAGITLNWGGPQFQLVPVKIVVEGGGTPIFHSDQFGLAFSDSPANVSFQVTFRDGVSKPAAPLTRIERTSEPFLASSVIPMPAFPNGEFRLLLPEGILRLGQVSPIKAPAGPTSGHVVAPARTYYYVKSVKFGTTDLMKELMTLRGLATDTLTITLARCSDTTIQELLCQ